jgi:hypothetical protein
MNANRAVRIIKRNQKQDSVAAATVPTEPKTSTAAESYRNIKMTVSSWVRERRERLAEDRQTFNSLFQQA